MKKLLSLLCFTFLSLAGALSATASEVLIVTWQGQLQSERTFIKQLKKLRPNVKFSFIDAERKKDNLATLLRNYDMSKIDLVYSFGTTSTKMVKEFLRGRKPHVFNIVSAPVLSGIAKSIEKPENNLTGARFLVDMDIQIEILQKLKNVKKLAVWYDPREKQNQIVLSKIKAVAEAAGIEVRPFRIIPDSKKFDTQLKQAALKSNAFEALYLTPSSSFSAKYKEMISALDKKLLIMGTISTNIHDGATVAVSPIWDERSTTVAQMANKILGGTQADSIPISVITREKVKLTVNKDRMTTVGLKDLDKLGITIVYESEK